MVNVVAQVEKVTNGYVVSVAGEKFVATDCIDLASVFSDVFEAPEVRVDLTAAGRAALEGLDLRTGEELLIDHLVKKSNEARAARDERPLCDSHEYLSPESFTCLRCGHDMRRDEWPSVPTPPAEPSPPTPLPAPEVAGEGSQDEVTRAPIADDGYEFPPVKQLGANHFVVVCPAHGDQRMERRGAAWVCPRKDKNAECATRIPRDAMSRAVLAA